MKKGLRLVGSYMSNQWYERLSAFFVAAILASCLSVFEGYWWPESYSISYYTIGAAALIHFLLPLRMWFIRSLSQLAATIFIVFRLARREWLIAPPLSNEPADLWWWMQQHLAQLHPFVWFGLSLMVIQIMLAVWSTTRPRLFGVVGAGVLLLTVADSFTPIWLWDDVAIVVFTGLIWLVANHLAKLQRSHPDSWREVLEYPIGLLSPAIIVLALLMLIGLNMPSLPPLLQDPYTIWKNARGEQVTVNLGEKAIVREETPVSNGNVSSGYSRSDSELGGGFDYDYSPMMTVNTNRRSYWRGESKDIYNGRGWDDSEVPGAIMPGALEIVRQNQPFLDENRSLAETVEVNQIVTMIREDQYPVLFGAAAISTINWVDGENESFPNDMFWLSNQWELTSSIRSGYPQIYALTSQATVLNEEGLRSSESGFQDVRQHAQYTNLPPDLPERVAQLAADITAEATNDYDRAKLLETYLRSNYAYNNKPDLTKLSGESTDFVDQFLFELWEGYCDYFSTAMAVMARTLDMPARWVKGFTPGSLPVDPGMMPGEMMGDINPDGQGTYTVRNSDAHSWVEIYFEGYGWISFEPTAGFSFPYTMPEGEAPVLPDFEASDPAAAPEAAAAGKTGSVSPWVWVTTALIGAAGLLWLVLKRLGGFVGVYRKLGGRTYSSNELIVLETGKLLRMCKRRGLKRDEHETLREAVQRWSLSRKFLKDDFRFVLDGFEKAKYGAVNATKEETDRFVQKIHYLIGELK